MKVLVIGALHPELAPGQPARFVWELFEWLRRRSVVQAVLLVSVDRSMPALFKPGAHITAFDGRPDEYLFLSHDVDPWWHRNGEPLLVEAFAEFLGLVRPNAVHFHGFATFGAELLTLTRRTLPACRIVFTFHDLLAVCAAEGRMLRLTDGASCDHASPVRCHQCFPEIFPESFFLRAGWLRTHLLAADVLTVPDRSMLPHLIGWGLSAERLMHVPHDAGAMRQFLARYRTGRSD